MGRAPCCERTGLKKGAWTQEEDEKLVDYIRWHGQGNWRTMPKNAGLARCGKSCRLRWTNYLRPDIKRGRFSLEEEDTIIHLHAFLGNKWSAIAARLPGRTDNEIKNHWNTHLRKRLLRMGIDPVTHAPRLHLSSLLNPAAAYYPDTQGLLSAPPAPTSTAEKQMLLQPWQIQAQQVPQAPPHQHVTAADHPSSACQMPGLVRMSPAQQLHQDHMLSCDYVQLPAGYDCQLDYVPPPMQMVSDTSNLQCSSTVTSSNYNCNVVGSGVSTPSSTSTTTFFANPNDNTGTDAISADAAGLFDMHLSDLLDVSDYYM